MKKLFIFLLIAIPLILYAQGFNSAHSPERNWFSYKNTSNFNQNRTNNNYIDQNSYVGLQNSMKFSGIGGYGNSVSSAGDLNNDGYDDLIVGFSGFGLSKVFIYFGGSIIDTVADLYLTGIRPTFGGSVSSAGDVNNDGYDDVIIGESGKAYIFYGGSPMDNIADVIFTGESSNYANSVSSAGDINNDGYDDVIVGASDYSCCSVPHIGRVYIYNGGTNMNNVADLIITGSGDYFGTSVSSAGDVNGDGYADVIVGATGYAVVYNEIIGRASIFYGGSPMDNIADVTMIGDTLNSDFGWSTSDAGDVNGDGYSDVIVGAYRCNSNTGKSYIFYGGNSMNNIADLILKGENENDNFGYSVSGAKDLNNDGYSDLIIGAYNNNEGKVYIFNGGETLNNNPDFILYGDPNNRFGFSVSDAGDINNDNFNDIIIGAPSKVYLFFNAINLVNPQNNSINNSLNLILEWKRVYTAVNYTFEISSDSLFINSILIDSILLDTFKIITGLNKDTKYFWRVRVNDNSGVIYNSSIWNFKTIPPKKINLSISMEGLYNPFFNQLMRKDSVTVYLRDTYSPFSIRDSACNIIDSVNLSGSFIFPDITTGTYYVNVKHFNSIETWSKSGGEYLLSDGFTFNYDFTTSISRAFGNNLKLIGGKYCIFSGDCNQDGSISLSDVILVYNSSVNFNLGTYLQNDLNGDSNVDLSDIALCYNNSISFVNTIFP